MTTPSPALGSPRVSRAWIAAAALVALGGALSWGFVAWTIARRLPAGSRDTIPPPPAFPLHPAADSAWKATFPDAIFDAAFEAQVQAEAEALGLGMPPRAAFLARSGLLRRGGTCASTLTAHAAEAPPPGSPELEVQRFCALQMVLEDLRNPDPHGRPPHPPEGVELTPAEAAVRWEDVDEAALQADLARAAEQLGLDPAALPPARELWSEVTVHARPPPAELRRAMLDDALPGMLDGRAPDPVRDLLLLHLLVSASGGMPPTPELQGGTLPTPPAPAP